jgi:hypothetical protein
MLPPGVWMKRSKPFSCPSYGWQHEAVLVFVDKLDALNFWFAEKARVVADYVPAGTSMQLQEIFLPNLIGGGLAARVVFLVSDLP